ncbi:mCG147760 [Mus musculus]|nr:mCG147760 [Mus musculus]
MVLQALEMYYTCKHCHSPSYGVHISVHRPTDRHHTWLCKRNLSSIPVPM